MFVQANTVHTIKSIKVILMIILCFKGLETKLKLLSWPPLLFIESKYNLSDIKQNPQQLRV